ncbi:protein EXORDIUM-like 2 [Quercus lobata]|uniref:Protein EXORDIUM-like 2 n=1 Tax=Quercus lobata TaxID=97700 RepID=A0A7N2N352_QUELO|nr:protein EXORDIUM-like 2 [Quercus lobata]
MVTMFLKSMLFPLIFALALAPRSQGVSQSRSQSQPSLATTFNEIKYHGGPLLTKPNSINIYLIWYGAFSRNDRSSITDFFASFNPSKGLVPHQEPTVATWWKTIQTYKDKSGNSVSSTVKLVKQIGDIYSLGKNIKRAQIANYVKHKIETKVLPFDSNGIYLVLTSRDVIVERFCMGSCGFHDNIVVYTERTRLVYAHIGNPLVQCPGLCAWPYSLPAYGPPGQQALVAPNGVGADGMVMNIATIIAGATTNPFKNGYFQGDPLAPLEAVTACPGIFGEGAYSGYPGNLMVDKISKASYNAYGANGRKFLLPAIWELTSSKCKVIH